MSAPKVSVVMPAYNAAPFIRAAIDSVLSQTYQDLELIILNDGSTDDTRAIVKSYYDPRIRLVNKSNSGVASTLNLGLELAKGELMWRHDADDVSLPEKLERQVTFLENHPEFVLCATQIAFMTERGKIAWEKRQPKSTWLGTGEFREVRFEDFSPFSPVTHGTTLFRRSILEHVPTYREEFITSEDIDMWLRMLEHGKLAVLNQCLSLHRLSSASATAVHGWKNEFYRELAKEFYRARMSGQPDSLALTGKILEPAAPVVSQPNTTSSGKLFRKDLLNFHYTVCLDAKDSRELMRIIRLALRDGWRLQQTYRSLVFPLLPKFLIHLGVLTKGAIRKILDRT